MVSQWLILGMVIYPLMGVVFLWLFPRMEAGGLFLRTAALPAALGILWVNTGAMVELDWFLLGTRLGIRGDIGRIFLVFTSLLWLMAGWYGARYTKEDPHRGRFSIFWLLSFCGNLGLILSADIPTFYASFTLMSLSSYALVVHTRSPRALSAGRTYLIMALLSEVLVLGGLLLLALGARTLEISLAVEKLVGTPQEYAVLLLLVAGFGVKAGMFPLHIWLPLAHPVAPTPASAVLSGSMIKAGILGWITFLPGGVQSYPLLSSIMIALGAIAALGAVVAGLFQQNPKTTLAYSSISQMGVVTICLGVGLADGPDWHTAQIIAALYVLNHAFAKGALFMGVGVVQFLGQASPRLLRLADMGLCLAALAIAGAPLTGGALAKNALKYFAPSEHYFWGSVLQILLPISALFTTMLLVRFLYLLRGKNEHSTGEYSHDGTDLLLPWGLTLGAMIFMAWWTVSRLDLPIFAQSYSPLDLLKSAGPIILGLLAGYVMIRRQQRYRVPVPPGDILVLYRALSAGLVNVKNQIRHIGEKFSGGLEAVLNLVAGEKGKTDNFLSSADRVMRRLDIGLLAMLLLIILVVALR